MNDKNSLNASSFSLFNFTLAFYPWFACYATFINGVSIGDALVLLAIILEFGKTKSVRIVHYKPNFIHFLFLVYCFLAVTLMTIYGKTIDESLVINRFLKYGVFIFVICLYPSHLNKIKFLKYFRTFILLLISGLIVQYVFRYILGISLALKVPFLSYCNDAVEQINFSERLANNFRPSSFLLEPAGLSYILISYLVYQLFQKEHDKYWVYRVIVLTIAPVLTTSSTALILLLIVYVSYIMYIVFNSDKSLSRKISYIITISIVGAVLVYLYLSSSLVYSLNRMLYSENEILAQSVWSRLSNGNELVDSLTGIERFIGKGLGNIPSYTNSINYLLYCTGYVGLIIMFAWAFATFIRVNISGKVLLVVFIALWFSSRIVISGEILLYNAFFIIYSSFISKNQIVDMNDKRVHVINCCV